MEAYGGALPTLEPAPACGATAGYNDNGAPSLAPEEFDHESSHGHDSATTIPLEHACDYFEFDSWTVSKDALSSDHYVNNDLSGYNSLFPETPHESYWEQADESGLFMETTVECFPPKFEMMECQDNWTLMAEQQSTLHLVLNITDRSNSIMLQETEPTADLKQMQIPLLELQDVPDDICCHQSQVSLSNETPLFYYDHAFNTDVAAQDYQRGGGDKTDPTMLECRRDQSSIGYAYLDLPLEHVPLPNHDLLSFGNQKPEVLQNDCLQQLADKEMEFRPATASFVGQTSPDAFNSEEDENVLGKQMFVESVIDSCCLSNSSSDSSGYSSTFKPYNAADEHPKAYSVRGRHTETNDACSLAFTEHLEKETGVSVNASGDSPKNLEDENVLQQGQGNLELLVSSVCCLSNSSDNVVFSSRFPQYHTDEHPGMCLARARHTIKKKRQNKCRVPRKKIRLVQTGEPSEDSNSESRKPLISRKKKAAPKKSMERAARFKATLLPPEPVKILQSWLSTNMGNPYPTQSEKDALTAQTGFTMRQVQNWMSNARYRLGIQRKHSSYSSSI